ncbi:hydroxyacid dehydrogenase, partial [Candidatus Woesearchaeota archaeon]
MLREKGYNVVVFEGREPPREWLIRELVDADVLVIAPIHVINEDI